MSRPINRLREVSDRVHGGLIVWGSAALHIGTWITFGFGPALMLAGVSVLIVAVVTA